MIFILGTNDGAADTGYEKLYGDLYAPFKKAGVQVLFFGPPYWPREITFAKPGEDPSEKAKAQTDKLNDDMAEVAVLQKKVFGKAWHDSRPMTLDIPASGRAKQAHGGGGERGEARVRTDSPGRAVSRRWFACGRRGWFVFGLAPEEEVRGEGRGVTGLDKPGLELSLRLLPKHFVYDAGELSSRERA